MTSEDVFAIVAKKYQTKPVYKWMKFPKYAVFEHENEGKWFGIIMNVEKSKIGLSGSGEVDVMDVKATPETEEEILDLLDKSYHLTK